MGPVVLLVDDDANFATLVKLAFTTAWPDAVLQIVGDGKDAIQYLLGYEQYADRQQFPVPSLMLLDLNMPRIDGFQVLAWKREIPELNALPVVVWSTSDLPENVQQAYSLEAVAYLVKPTTLNDYMDIVKRLKNISMLPDAIKTSPWVWSSLCTVENAPLAR